MVANSIKLLKSVDPLGKFLLLRCSAQHCGTAGTGGQFSLHSSSVQVRQITEDSGEELQKFYRSSFKGIVQPQKRGVEFGPIMTSHTIADVFSCT